MFTNRMLPLVVALCAALAACGGKNNDENNVTPNGTPNNMTTNVTPNNMTTNVTPNSANNCAGVANSCATAGTACVGDLLTTCAADANGCLVEASEDCTVGAQSCGDLGGGPACIAPQPCTDDAACGGITDGGRFCSGDVLTTCTADAEGCLVASTLDCAATGEACDMDTQACIAACADDPACAGLVAGDSFCSGDGGTATVCSDANADGCLEPTDTACLAGEICDATGATAMCASACPEAVQTISCADAGMTINGDTANGSAVIGEYGCAFPGDDYSANESIFVFNDVGNNDVTISFTFDDVTINEFDAFALLGDGVCTDATLTCESSDFAFSSPGDLTFGADAGQTYYVVLDPFNAAGLTTAFGIDITCVAPVCGDGTIGAGEGCDDGNTTDGDGCSAACTVEANWLCNSEPSICIEEICGDGVITQNEACDDMNTADGDGCAADCTQEMGYICMGEPSACVPDVCGDGILAPTEECDDSNLNAADGCSATCDVEFGFECDAAGANCMAIPSIGTFGAGDVIPDTTGGPITAGESDFWMITFTDIVRLSGSASVGTTGDIDVEFTSDTGTFINSAANGDETITDQFLPAGTYMIDLEAFGGTDIDTYVLALSTVLLASTDIGTFAAAATIPDQTGGPLLRGDSDWYTITVSDDVMLTGSLTADAGDVDLFVYSADGVFLIGSASDGDEAAFELALFAGSYLVQVSSWAQATADVGTYTLTLTDPALNVPDIGMFAAGDVIAAQTGGPLTDGQSTFYTVTFSNDVTLDAVLTNGTGDTGLTIYDVDMGEVRSFAFGDELVTGEAISAGTYIVVISAFSGDVDTFTLTLTTN